MREDDLCELGVVKTATPCEEPWENMRGDGAVRFCDRCRLNVYDFSQLTTSEARALLVETEGRLCGRIFTRGDGTVMTRDCPTAISQQRRKRVGVVAAAAALLAGIAAAALTPERTCQLAVPALVPVDDPRPPPIRSANSRGHMMGALGMIKPAR